MNSDIRPEWLMVGWQADGWCWLIASRELESAQLDWIQRRYDFRSWDEFLSPGAFTPAWHIDVVSTGKAIIVRGRTFADCLADLLFKHGWRADVAQGELPTHDPIRGHLAARAAEAIDG